MNYWLNQINIIDSIDKLIISCCDDTEIISITIQNP